MLRLVEGGSFSLPLAGIARGVLDTLGEMGQYFMVEEMNFVAKLQPNMLQEFKQQYCKS